MQFVSPMWDPHRVCIDGELESEVGPALEPSSFSVLYKYPNQLLLNMPMMCQLLQLLYIKQDKAK